MRLIGHLENEDAARTLSDFLYVQGIENQLERELGVGWGLWIHSEDQIEQAKAWFVTYVRDPVAAQFREEAAQAGQLREKRERENAAYVEKTKDLSAVFRSVVDRGFGPLTMGLIAICVLVFVLEDFGRAPQRVMPLFITDFHTVASDEIAYRGGLSEILHGQVWRLFTPIFLHFGFLHIFFNMLWLRELGGQIESRQGALRLGLLILGIAGVSNFVQFLSPHSGPMFGGMSGVVFGLAGYIWIRGKFDPGSGLFLPPITVAMMFMWGIACLAGFIPHIANGAHVGGMATGIAWGYLSSLRYR